MSRHPRFAQDAVDVAKAKAEGKVVWYTSTPLPQAQKIVNMFEKEYGIKVELFRSGGSAILRRFQQEADAGRIAADVLTTSDPAAAAMLTRKGMFVAFKPKNFDKVPDAAKDKDGNFIAPAAEPDDELPALRQGAGGRRAEDLGRPRRPEIQGQDGDRRSVVHLAAGVGGRHDVEERGWGFYEKLRANDTMVVQGNQQAADMLKRGERLIAVGALDSYAAEDRAAGHPMKTLYPSDGVFVIPSPTSVVKGGPNPNAAKLFAEFIISDEVQKMFPADGGFAARSDIAAPAGSPRAVEPEDPAGGLRLHREGSAADQEDVQRDFQQVAASYGVALTAWLVAQPA